MGVSLKQKPKIKECFFRTSDGKCCSPEIYRFVPQVEATGICPFESEQLAFFEGKLRCQEFRPKEEVEK